MHKYGYVSSHTCVGTYMTKFMAFMYTFNICLCMYTYISHKYTSFMSMDIHLILETPSLHVKLINLGLSAKFIHYNVFPSSIFSLGCKVPSIKSRPRDDKHNTGSLNDQELAMLINISINYAYCVT